MTLFLKHALKFFGSIIRGMKDAKFRSLLFFVLVILFIGTYFYHRVEGWRWLDSFYFSSISLTTVGYGDITPKTDLGKIFTVFYIFSGVGVILGFITSVANKAHEKSVAEEIIEIKYKRRMKNNR